MKETMKFCLANHTMNIDMRLSLLCKRCQDRIFDLYYSEKNEVKLNSERGEPRYDLNSKCLNCDFEYTLEYIERIFEIDSQILDSSCPPNHKSFGSSNINQIETLYYGNQDFNYNAESIESKIDTKSFKHKLSEKNEEINFNSSEELN